MLDFPCISWTYFFQHILGTVKIVSGYDQEIPQSQFWFIENLGQKKNAHIIKGEC